MRNTTLRLLAASALSLFFISFVACSGASDDKSTTTDTSATQMQSAPAPADTMSANTDTTITDSASTRPIKHPN